jgi:AmiR/NasT family two-component response regulator
VDTLRILLVAVPRLLADILRAMPDPDVRIVGEVAGIAMLRPDLERTDANVVVIATSDPALPSADRWLLEPSTRLRGVVSITPDGRRATLHVLRPHQQPLGEVGPHEILRALREAMRGTEALR